MFIIVSSGCKVEKKEEKQTDRNSFEELDSLDSYISQEEDIDGLSVKAPFLRLK
jgi:hypothetical protein